MTPTAPPTLTNAEAAQHIARALGPVLPICYHEDGACACGGRYDRDSKAMVPHVGKELGKAPVSALVRNGLSDATRNSATIDRHWRAKPRAGVALALEVADVLFIDPDSPEALAEARREGVAGGMRRDSRNVGWLFKRPADCPIISITKSADGADLEIRTTGYAAVWNTHADGSPVRVDLSTHLVDAPAWAVERLKRKAAERAAQAATRATRRAERAENGIDGEPPVRLSERAMRRWRGDLMVEKNGKLDRSDSLYFIALDLAEHGASEAAIEAALRERDVALGWEKFTHRDDADDRYREAAERAVAWVVAQEKAPKLRIAGRRGLAGNPAADELTRARAEIAELRETVKDLTGWVDRLAAVNEDQKVVINRERDQKETALETIRAMFDVMAIPDAQLNARTKLVYLFTGREAASRNSRGVANLPNAAIAEGTGLGEDVVSEIMQDIQARERSPIARRITREWVTNGDGQQEPRSVAQVRITTDERTFVSMLRAAPTMGGPSEKAQQKKAKAKARAEQSVQARIEAAAQPWGHCSQCDNLEVAVTGACPDHLEVVGETIIRREAFEVLNPEMQDSGDRATPPTVSLVPKRPAMQDSGVVANGPNGHGEYLIKRDPSLPPVDVDVTGTCRGCRGYTVWRCVGGVTSCTACQAILHVEARSPEQPPLIPDDPPRATNGHYPPVPGAFR